MCAARDRGEDGMAERMAAASLGMGWGGAEHSLPGGREQRQTHPLECAYVCPTQGQIHKPRLGCAVAEGISQC